MAIGLVDIYFVARLGAKPLAALSFTFPIVLTLSAISLGLSNGVVAVIARAVGEDDHEGIRALGTDSILLGLSFVLVLSVTGYATIDPLFTLLGADGEVMPLIKQYMHIWYIGILLQIIPQLGQSILRAHGDTRTPSLITLVMSVTNVLLDPILIFGWGVIPALGIRGAVVSNILARALSLVGVLSALHFRFHALAPISFSPARLRNSWKKLLHIGLPSTATQLVMPISAAVVTKIIALSGTLAVAAYGVGSRIESLTSIYLWAVAGALPAFVGQNAGAGRMDRVREAVGIAIKFCVTVGLCMIVITMLAAPEIVGHFTKDANVSALASYYLRVVSLSYALSGLVIIASQTMNALHRPLPAAAIGLTRTVGVLVPFALLGQWLGQIHGVFIGIAMAGATCGAIAWLVLTKVLAQESRHQPTPPDEHTTELEAVLGGPVAMDYNTLSVTKT